MKICVMLPSLWNWTWKKRYSALQEKQLHISVILWILFTIIRELQPQKLCQSGNFLRFDCTCHLGVSKGTFAAYVAKNNSKSKNWLLFGINKGGARATTLA